MDIKIVWMYFSVNYNIILFILSLHSCVIANITHVYENKTMFTISIKAKDFLN